MNELTYDFEKKSAFPNLIGVVEKNEIVVSIKGRAKNTFGVPQSVTSHIHFDNKGDLLYENGHPHVSSFHLRY